MAHARHGGGFLPPEAVDKSVVGGLEQTLEALAKTMRHAASDVDKHVENSKLPVVKALQELRLEADQAAAKRQMLEDERDDLLRQIALCDRQLDEVQALQASASERKPFWAFCMCPAVEKQASEPEPIGEVDVRSVEAIMVSGAGSPAVNGRYICIQQGADEVVFVNGEDEDLCIQWFEASVGDQDLPPSWQIMDSYNGRTFYFSPHHSARSIRLSGWEVCGRESLGHAAPPAPLLEVVAQ